MPDRFGWFLGGIVLISLLMHFAIQRYAPRASEILLPIATLLNGIGYVEIARWNPPYAKTQRCGSSSAPSGSRSRSSSYATSATSTGIAI